MSLNRNVAPQQRRGRALEEALLCAAWEELTERGYDDFTIDGAAARAGTSRAVLYRRWSSKQELVIAALAHAAGKDVVVAPDTGSLRGDVIGLLQQANKVRIGLAAQVFIQLGSLYQETGTGLAGLSAYVRGGGTPPWRRRSSAPSIAARSSANASPNASDGYPRTCGVTKS